MNSILDLSIEEMHIALKEGKFKPSDLVKASIEKAKENQDVYNAFVTILEESLELAYELDKSFDNDNPLYGIPYACKDNYSTKGILSTGSSNILKNYVPVYDATVVKKLNIYLLLKVIFGNYHLIQQQKKLIYHLITLL